VTKTDIKFFGVKIFTEKHSQNETKTNIIKFKVKTKNFLKEFAKSS